MASAQTMLWRSTTESPPSVPSLRQERRQVCCTVVALTRQSAHQ